MSLFTNALYEENKRRSMDYDEKKVFLRMIRSGNYEIAKEFADILLNKRYVTRTSINRAGFNLVERLKISRPEDAKNLCKVFTEYKWINWL